MSQEQIGKSRPAVRLSRTLGEKTDALVLYCGADLRSVRSSGQPEKTSLYLAVFRQLCLNIPIMLMLNSIFGMTGIIWTQMPAEMINVIISYLIYAYVIRRIRWKARVICEPKDTQRSGFSSAPFLCRH